MWPRMELGLAVTRSSRCTQSDASRSAVRGGDDRATRRTEGAQPGVNCYVPRSGIGRLARDRVAEGYGLAVAGLVDRREVTREASETTGGEAETAGRIDLQAAESIARRNDD